MQVNNYSLLFQSYLSFEDKTAQDTRLYRCKYIDYWFMLLQMFYAGWSADYFYQGITITDRGLMTLTLTIGVVR